MNSSLQSNPLTFRLLRSFALPTRILMIAALPISAQQAKPDREIKLKLGESDFTMRERVREGPCKLVFFAPHDDESVCVKVTEEVIEKHGGRLLELKSSGKNNQPDRYLNFSVHGKSVRVDPNRIFSKVGIIKALKHSDGRNGREVTEPGALQNEVVTAVLNFGQAILAELRVADQPLFVSLHNNRPGESIWMTKYVAERKGKPGLYFWNRGLDEDDLFITTSIHLLDTLTSRGYNVVYEGSGEDDGSLSVFCWKHKPAIPYVNIEAQHTPGGEPGSGHITQQRRMVEAIVIYHLNQTQPKEKQERIPTPIR